MNKGELTSWNTDKGYGFIHCDSTLKDIFIHISSLKNMSRKPKVGDFIYFDIETKNNGKVAASNCRIEGVLPLKSLTSNTRYTSRASARSNNKVFKARVIQFLLVLSIIITVFSYINQRSPINQSSPVSQSLIKDNNPRIVSKTTQFSCDGRQHCSQMNSRAEAEFFIQHCPNTKMDGDHDGIPCENDSRF